MEWIETTGPSVEAAKETAIDLLGVAIDEAEFEVVEVEKTGLLGRVKAPARVRARVLPKTPQRRDDRRNRNRTKSSGSDRTQILAMTLHEVVPSGPRVQNEIPTSRAQLRNRRPSQYRSRC